MNIIFSALLIFLVSFLWAVFTSGKETSVPEEVKKIRIAGKKKKLSGVILFLRDRVIHYQEKG